MLGPIEPLAEGRVWFDSPDAVAHRSEKGTSLLGRHTERDQRIEALHPVQFFALMLLSIATRSLGFAAFLLLAFALDATGLFLIRPPHKRLHERVERILQSLLLAV